jgi:hypothetical protein
MINDDTHIINEWIVHHIININIDHIYIYDDRSKKSISKTISILPEDIKEKVTVITIEDDINFYNHNDFKNSIYYDMELYIKSENVKQIYFHNHFLKNYKNVSKWCYLCDVDEFIYLNNNINLDNILNEYDNFDIIFIPWLIYGSSFHIDQPQGLVIDNFKYHSNKYHKIGKSFYKMNMINYISNPHIINNNHTCFQFSYTEKIFNLPIHINHYQINSIKTYISKKLKLEIGYAGGKMRDPNDIFLFMLSNNDMYSDIMNIFSENINIILKKDNSNKLEDNLNIIYCSNCLYVNEKIIFNISTYNELLKILNSDNIKYQKFKSILPHDFNVKSYRLLNNDLNNSTDSELMNHYILFGSNENRKYLNTKKNKNNKEKIESIKSIKSNSSDNLKIKDNTYPDNNSDLENIENNSYDNKINKDESSDSDLSDFDKLSFDFDTLPDDFDVEVYKNLNKDLKNMSNIDAINHYINFGKKEKRIYIKSNDKKIKISKNNTNTNTKYYNEPVLDFDAKIYKELNKDLQYLTDGEAIYHYLTYGINEKREYKRDSKKDSKKDTKKDTKKDSKKNKKTIIDNRLPNDFNPILYKELNKDLQHFNDEEAIEHYLIHGVNEKRSYKKNKNKDRKRRQKKEITIFNGLPTDFNPILYKELNKDLQHFNDEEAIEHYLIHGVNEKRSYKKNKNKDRKRRQKKEITIFNGLPTDFNPILYKELNKDLQHFNDEEAIEHYLIHGINEKRKYLINNDSESDKSEEDESASDKSEEEESASDKSEEDESASDKSEGDDSASDKSEEDESASDKSEEDESASDKSEEDESASDKSENDDSASD